MRSGGAPGKVSLATLPRLHRAAAPGRADRPGAIRAPTRRSRDDLQKVRAIGACVVRHRQRIDRGDLPLDPMSQYADNEYLFTSESVTEGHPDKVADQISDGVLDAVLRDDPYGRVACETLVNTGLVVVSGEISTDDLRRHPGDRPRDDPQDRLRRRRPRLQRRLVRRPQRDRQAVARHRPGRRPGLRGAHRRLRRRRARRRRRRRPGHDVRLRVQRDARADAAADLAGPQAWPSAWPTSARPRSCRYLRPDGKTQVSVRYRDGRPVEIEKLLISTQHKEGAESLIPDDLWEHVVEPVLPKDLYDADEAAQELPRQPDRPLRHRRPGRRRGPDRPQDHRRHLRRHGPPRRRRVLAARTRRRSTARPPTRRARSPRTSSPPASPTAARSRSPTRSASRTRSR